MGGYLRGQVCVLKLRLDRRGRIDGLKVSVVICYGQKSVTKTTRASKPWSKFEQTFLKQTQN